MPIVLFGISGSIAAYKALDIIRLLIGDGVEVYPVLSEGGTKFVTRATIEAICGRRAVTEIFPESAQQEIEHIALAQKADLLVTCPASADILAKYATGISDDPLALVALAFGFPHLIAPAMNHRMWEHPATKANVHVLKERGCVFVGPDKGMMACGEEGWGRLASIDDIYGHIAAQLGAKGPLAGKKILISSGATKEAIDDVRYITNHSSGKMGYALAEAARNLGAEVTLVQNSGYKAPGAVQCVNVVTTSDMYEAVMKHSSDSDAIIMAAAISDFTPEKKIDGKLKKESLGATLDIRLVRTSDILKELGKSKKPGQVLVGFAAEHGASNHGEAVRKCREKGCDFICVNDISRDDIGFGSDYNELTIIYPDGKERNLPREKKKDIASAVMNEIAGKLPQA